MLRLRPLATFALGVVLAACTAVPPPDARLDGLDKGEAGELLEPGDWMIAQRAAPGLSIPAGAYERAVDQAIAMRARTAATDPALAGAAWTWQGPTNIGGRVVDLAVDPLRSGGIYAATASGGVWKSDDAGVTFRPVWPSDASQSMGALAAAPAGTLYAGTGEANPGGGSLTFGGTGLYRSRDGGRSWQRVGLETAGTFGRIVVDPSDPSRIFAAAAGNLFVPGGERGLYRSTDGGDIWELVLTGDNPTTGAVDVALDPDDPATILVAMWDHARYADRREYGGPGSGVWRSIDGGDTWARLTGGPRAPFEETGRIGVAFGPSGRAYAIVVTARGYFSGIWRSDDAGATWREGLGGDAASSQSSYGWWFGRLWVDPASADHVFLAGIELLESLDGGASFIATTASAAGIVSGSNLAPAHADQHAMAWDPRVPGLVWLGNDGGVYRSVANGAAGSWVGGVRQGWTQHYSVDVGEQNPGRIVTGLQDNLCRRNYVSGGAGRADTWGRFGLCGDGLETLISPADENIVYACSQYGSCTRSTDGGVVPGPFGTTISTRRGWWTPLQFDPSNPQVMYYGGNRLNRSTNGGLSWSVISPDLTLRTPQNDPSYLFHTITTVAAARTDGAAIYVGTDDGLLWVTRNRGTTWTRLADPDLPEAWVTRVAVDPDDANLAYAAFSGYRGGSSVPHLLRTSDGGATWDDISGDLPDAPVNDVVVAGEALVAGTDVGVFLSLDGGATWSAVGHGLPVVPVLDMRYHAPSGTLTVATFGRGIMRVVLP